MRKQTEKLRLVTIKALFCALAYAAVFVIRISGIGGFLTLDIKDTVISVAALLFGPVTGISIALIVSLVEMITVSATGFWGFIMNFVSSAVFASAVGAFYNYAPKIKKTFAGALFGLLIAVPAGTLIMLLMNIIITPIYTGMSMESVVSMIPKLLLPFNLIKYVLNAALIMMIYKPVSIILKRSGVNNSASEEKYLSKRTMIVFVISGAVLALCIVLLVTKLGGRFSVV